MLKPEEIAKKLESAKKVAPWLEARMDRLARFDSTTRTIGRLMLGVDEKGKRESQSMPTWRMQIEGAERLKTLDEPELLRLGEAFFPRFPDAFKAAWKLHERLPFQRGFAPKPFRAPTRPDLLIKARRRFLANLLSNLEGYDEDLVWLAAHASHLATGIAEQFGLLLAAAIDLGGTQARDIEQVLRDSASGLHEIGQMGRHVTAAFLCSQKPECWEFVEKLLLAAQRQEGLRQAILESIDFSHPDAFRHMLRVIDENGLTRFSSTVRAVDVWLGLLLDSASEKYVSEMLQSLTVLLDDEVPRNEAISGDDVHKAYLALWSIAFEDAPAAIPVAAELIRHQTVEFRFLAVHILGMLGLRESYDHVLPAVDDADLRVAVYGAAIADMELGRRMLEQNTVSAQNIAEIEAYLTQGSAYAHVHVPLPPQDSGDLFERLEQLYERVPVGEKEQKPLVWPWMKVGVGKKYVADRMVTALGTRPASRLLPYLDSMSPESRMRAAYLLGTMSKLDSESRSTLVRLIGDPAGIVRETAVRAMTKIKLKPAELPPLEALLDRRKSDLRRGVLTLILSLEDSAVLASAARLMESKIISKRLAGLDLLKQLQGAGRSIDLVRTSAEAFGSSRKKLEHDEQVYLNALTQTDSVVVTLDDAAGLMDTTKRTPPTWPQAREVKLSTPATIELIKLFDDAIHEHREETVTFKRYDGEQETQPLGAINHGFPGLLYPDLGKLKVRSLDELPLRDLWFKVWENRPTSARDGDGLEAVRASFVTSLMHPHSAGLRDGWRQEHMKQLVGTLPEVKYRTVLSDVLGWIVFYETKANVGAFVMDAFETLLASIPKDKLTDEIENRKQPGLERTFRDQIHGFSGLSTTLQLIAEHKNLWTSEHARRMFLLMRWIDEPFFGATPQNRTDTTKAPKIATKQGPAKNEAMQSKRLSRDRMDWFELLEAFRAGFANPHDLFDHLLGARTHTAYGGRSAFDALNRGTYQLLTGALDASVAPIVRRAMERVLEIELTRGETETVVTPAAMAMRYSGGLDALLRVLKAIGRDPKLQRTYTWGTASQGKSPVFSHLIRVSMPGKDETPEQFREAAKAAGIDEPTLLAVAFYAPQWARHVQLALGWPLFEEAVWWFHAHTKDNAWRIEHAVREAWNAEIRKLTPLSLEDLMEGAVDVDWFHRTHKAIGQTRWARLDEFAKYASGGAGHKRAQLFAQAMLGNLKKLDLGKDIEARRKQDSLRALGLLPLDKKTARNDVLERYTLMQEFIRTSRQFGSLRQSSEKLAARIGQENLARTAGYADPTRLQWAMEGLATADLAAGPVTVTVNDLTVSLAIDADGLPEITVKRGDKWLKSLPPEARKNEAVAELTERKTHLRRSASRMRQSLELAMCRGDSFTGESLQDLMGNVILRPMLERLVFRSDLIAGYPVSQGKGLRGPDGTIEPVKKDETLRLAHPVDFLASKQWTQWQHDCFANERIQPFKQVFRELYILTEAEKSDSTFSHRYAGQQVNPRQTLALLGSRGWVTAPEAGVFRTFHEEKLVAWIEFMEPFHTPAEVEGLTVEKVRFARRGEHEYAKLIDVPPRLFSEVMRDVDLIVSVAHRGAVDPEASASTMQLRAALVRESIQLLKLEKVRVKEPHVYIRGSLAEYSVHLGSATTHMMPGGTLVIVPVHSQHRGRIFLPFADDDPKSAEILSKVILLARDDEIKDPNLLDQIRATR